MITPVPIRGVAVRRALDAPSLNCIVASAWGIRTVPLYFLHSVIEFLRIDHTNYIFTIYMIVF